MVEVAMVVALNQSKRTRPWIATMLKQLHEMTCADTVQIPDRLSTASGSCYGGRGPGPDLTKLDTTC